MFGNNVTYNLEWDNRVVHGVLYILNQLKLGSYPSLWIKLHKQDIQGKDLKEVG